MKIFSLLAIACTVFPLAASAAQKEGVGLVKTDAEKIIANGEGHTRNFPCNGRDLIVEGRKHTVTTTGVCKSVDVNGEGHSVTAEIAPNGKLIVGGTLHRS